MSQTTSVSDAPRSAAPRVDDAQRAPANLPSPPFPNPNAASSDPDLMSEDALRAQRELLRRITSAYRSRVVRGYCKIRLMIIHQNFLNEIGQYLPRRGDILDIGCGFGLFSLYYAAGGPQRRLHGYDLDARRIVMARLAARQTGIRNARFEHGDASRLALPRTYDAIYALDLLHHLPRETVPAFISRLHDALRPGGVLIVKDVDRRPVYKRWFTLALDRLMVGFNEPVWYWSRADLRAVLRTTGFDVTSHTMRDPLPYPHMLYVCRKPLPADFTPAAP